MSQNDCSITLYDVEVELQEAYHRVLELEQEGHQEELGEALSILEIYITESIHKRDKVGKFLESLDASSSSIDCEIERLQERKKRLNKVKSSMEAYILMILGRLGVTRLEGQLFSFISRKNPPSVSITDPVALPPEYLRQPEPPSPVPDKKLIKADLDRGVEIPGACLVQSQRLVIDN